MVFHDILCISNIIQQSVVLEDVVTSLYNTTSHRLRKGWVYYTSKPTLTVFRLRFDEAYNSRAFLLRQSKWGRLVLDKDLKGRMGYLSLF